MGIEFLFEFSVSVFFLFLLWNFSIDDGSGLELLFEINIIYIWSGIVLTDGSEIVHFGIASFFYFSIIIVIRKKPITLSVVSGVWLLSYSVCDVSWIGWTILDMCFCTKPGNALKPASEGDNDFPFQELFYFFFPLFFSFIPSQNYWSIGLNLLSILY